VFVLEPRHDGDEIVDGLGRPAELAYPMIVYTALHRQPEAARDNQKIINVAGNIVAPQLKLNVHAEDVRVRDDLAGRPVQKWFRGNTKLTTPLSTVGGLVRLAAWSGANAL
jgi:hypothetical protein